MHSIIRNAPSISSSFVMSPLYIKKSQNMPLFVHSWKSLMPNLALLVLMYCLKPKRPLNSSIESSTHKSRPGVCTALQCSHTAQRTASVPTVCRDSGPRHRLLSCLQNAEILTITESDHVASLWKIYRCGILHLSTRFLTILMKMQRLRKVKIFS